MSILYVGDSNNTSKKPKKSYVGYNGKAVEVFVQNEPKVYGVAWDGSATTTWTRTDDAKNFSNPNPYYAGMSGTPSSPFDDIQPWAGMVKSEDTNAGTVVAIPKFYYKLEYADGSSNGLKIQISTSEFDGSSVSPAHMDRGDGTGERDVVYVGRYHCRSSNTKSEKGEVGTNYRSNARNSIHSLGTKVWQSDFTIRFTIQLLYLVEFADWNSQNKIGYGCREDSWSTIYTGYTDSMPYHTGTTKSSRNTYGLGTQYRNIEGLWDMECFMDGCTYDGTQLRVILNPSNFTDSIYSGISIGTPTTGYPSKFTIKDVSGTFKTFIPTTSSGSTSTFSCDEWYFSSSSGAPFVGAFFDQSLNYGLFYIHNDYGDNNYKYRLMVLP